jgi:hypothetical protein
MQSRIVHWRQDPSGKFTTARWKKTSSSYYGMSKPSTIVQDRYQRSIDLGFRIYYGNTTALGNHYPVLQVLGVKNNRINSKDILLEIRTLSSWQTKDLIDCLLNICEKLFQRGFNEQDVNLWLFMQLNVLDHKEKMTVHDPGYVVAPYKMKLKF